MSNTRTSRIPLAIALVALTLVAVSASAGGLVFKYRNPAQSDWLSGSWSIDQNGADLTQHYNRDTLNPLDESLISSENPPGQDPNQNALDDAKRLASTQLGWFEGEFTMHTSTTSGIFDDGIPWSIATMRIEPGSGWFYSLDRIPEEGDPVIGSHHPASDWNEVGGAYPAGEYFKVSLAAPVSTGACLEFDTIDLLDGDIEQAQLFSLTTGPDHNQAPDHVFRNEHLELRVTGVNPGEGHQCTYEVKVDFRLIFVFEFDDYAFVPPAGTPTTNMFFQTGRIFATGGQTDADRKVGQMQDSWPQNPAEGERQMAVLYAPAIPIVWAGCASGMPREACIKDVIEDANSISTAEVFRSETDQGSYIVTSRLVNGVKTGYVHFVPDTDPISLSTSEVGTLNASNELTLTPWPGA